MALILTCQRCGGDMPPLDVDPDTEEGKETLRVLRTQGVTLAHEICPDQAEEVKAWAKATAPRRFEARVAIVEVVAPETEGGDATLVEMAAFIAHTDAADLEAAMRPLAAHLGEKWLEVEKHARIADAEAIEARVRVE